MQAIYVPADDYHGPGTAHRIRPHLDATTVLSRPISAKGIYPAVDPLDSTSRILDPRYVGEEHYQVAQRTKEILQRYDGAAEHHRHPRASTSCLRRTRSSSVGPGGSSGSYRRTPSWPRSSPAWTVPSCRHRQTVEAFKRLCAGEI